MQPSKIDISIDLNQSSIFGGLIHDSHIGRPSEIEGLDYHDQDINEQDTDNDILIKMYGLSY